VAFSFIDAVEIQARHEGLIRHLIRQTHVNKELHEPRELVEYHIRVLRHLIFEFLFLCFWQDRLQVLESFLEDVLLFASITSLVTRAHEAAATGNTILLVTLLFQLASSVFIFDLTFDRVVDAVSPVAHVAPDAVVVQQRTQEISSFLGRTVENMLRAVKDHIQKSIVVELLVDEER